MIHPTLDLTYMSSYEVEIKFVENLSRNTVLGPRQSVTVITSEADELVIRYLSYMKMSMYVFRHLTVSYFNRENLNINSRRFEHLKVIFNYQ